MASYELSEGHWQVGQPTGHVVPFTHCEPVGPSSISQQIASFLHAGWHLDATHMLP
jgi:hypothetical protein